MTLICRKIESLVLAFLLATLFLPGMAPRVWAQAPAAAQAGKPIESLPATEFARLVNEFSEEGGSFRSDNFTSNETSYLHIVDRLREINARGGVYLGVGPEQNFTYIAKIRPQIAFIIDIRRQAIIQHLMYKAVFHLAPTRPQFLSRLLCKPLPRNGGPGADAPLNDILAFLANVPGDEKAYLANLAEIRKLIRDEFRFKLTEADERSLEYVYQAFRDDGLNISYRMEGSWGNSSFPTLAEILSGKDLNERQGNFLASNEDYLFVREMHRRNLIIPVVGDFAGKKALVSIGDYVRKNGLTVTAYYTSNVEQYLFSNEVFDRFAANVKKLPITDKSVFIRAVAGRMPHPARLPGHRLATILQYISNFNKDYDAGVYQSYTDLVTDDFIKGEKP
jgi:hypothetical protein